MIANALGGTPLRVNGASWAGRKVRLRGIGRADHRTLIGFDRDSAGSHDGYRHWAVHRSDAPDAFAIETRHGGILVGSMCVQTDPVSGWFSYGIGIGARHRRCGYAGDAVTTLLTVMFGQYGYRKCEVSILGGNFASLSLHGGLGFREEGRPRDTELVRGGIKYPVLMGITAAEFDAYPFPSPVRPWRGRHWRTRRRGRHWRTIP
ncbi:GNAT family N-acetyltransferase [Kibdelosporangium philippinense]|uniref:GNAT family N-acetyltransferase n=1 Tax=Kibdelosporangium philippinense TaxID=211113 RepID=A0ABS8ZWT0_9PSEU|nr:GNAT family N-acetyltransferase [Kibdelosporangium philippinense]MCE7011500.1 GNAT family N-acetyltransferase [Kibdelosporangium philippinense]